MNEAAQVLRQTNHERKVAGYGVHHKKGGSAVSKLGNKPMSWQEINSKHGECKEYDLGGFMDYETFKKMDPDLEAEYVNKLCEKYHVRHEQVSKYLFELGESDLMARLKIKGVDKKIAKIKASDVSDDAIKDFRDRIDFWRQKTEAAKIIDLSEAQRKHNIIENAEFIEYEKIVTSQVVGEWTDEPNTPKYFTSTGGKQIYTEYHSFVCKSSFEDHYPVSAIFYIFEN